MPLRTQKQVMAGNAMMAGRALGRAAKPYRKETIGPMVRRIKKARGLKALLRSLGPGLLREMDSKALETALADAEFQAARVGTISALPRERVGKLEG